MIRVVKQLIFRTLSLWKNLLKELEIYLLGKAKHRPDILPLGRRVVIDSILDKKRNQETLQKISQESGIPLEQVEKTFRGYLHEIASDLNYLTIPFWDFGLTWIFDLVYEGLEVNTAALEKIRAHLGQKPIIFVSNHRSHMDYMILSYIFYNKKMTMPYVCAGANLSFWPLGPIFRRAGGFFVRRSYEGNKLYATAITAYMAELLEQNFNIEFFIEGGRSRTGKLLPPKMGILSAIVQSYMDGIVPDALLIPTSVTYESVLEEKSYLKEQSGDTKKDESIWDLLKLQKFLRRKKGKVYIEFGEPILLKDYHQEGPPLGSQNRRELVESLAYELTYGINRSTVVTPSSLVAMAILTHSKRCMSQTEMEEKTSKYLDYLRHKNGRLSEPLKKNQQFALQEALKNHVRHHLIEMLESDGEILYSVPEEKRGLLDYYKNSSLHFFVSMAVLATVLQAFGKNEIPLEEVTQQYSFLQELFKYEFTFSRRQELHTHLEKLLEYLENLKVLRREGSLIQLIPDSPNSQETLGLFSSALRNFFEGYAILWKTLPRLGKERWEIKTLLPYLKKRGLVAYLKEEISETEALSKSILQNALCSFRDLGLMEEEKEGLGKRTKTYYKVTTIKEEVRQYMTIYVHKLFTTCG